GLSNGSGSSCGGFSCGAFNCWGEIFDCAADTVKGRHRGDLFNAAIWFRPLCPERVRDPLHRVCGVLQILAAILEFIDEPIERVGNKVKRTLACTRAAR